MSEHPMQAGATEQSPKEFLCVLWGGGGARPPLPLPWIRHWVGIVKKELLLHYVKVTLWCWILWAQTN